jgi:hypothetical protein
MVVSFHGEVLAIAISPKDDCCRRNPTGGPE